MKFKIEHLDDDHAVVMWPDRWVLLTLPPAPPEPVVVQCEEDDEDDDV